MSENTTTEEKILANIENPTQSYEIDGEKTTLKDPEKQLAAYHALARSKVAKSPLRAILPFKMMSGRGDR